MKTTYYDDDTLVIRPSDKPIVREVSQDWNTHVSYAQDGSVAKIDAWPLEVRHAA